MARIKIALSLYTLLGIVIGGIFLSVPGNLDRWIAYDEGIYLVTAKSLVSGFGYALESLPQSPPQVKYPPFVPLFLAGLWRLFPDFPENVPLMRSAMMVFGVLFLFLSHLYLRDCLSLTGAEAVGIIAMVGLHPWFAFYSTALSSEIPYALLSMVSLYFYSRFISGSRRSHLALALGFAALAFFTRTIGLALFAAFTAHLLISRRARSQSCLIAVLCAAVCLLSWQLWSWAGERLYVGYPPEVAMNYQGYFKQILWMGWLGELPRALVVNFFELTGSWAHLIFPWSIWDLLAPVTIWPLLLHFFVRVFRRRSVEDLYCGFYLLIVLLWPWPHNYRFLFPISLFLAAYAFGTIKLVITAISKGRLEELAVTATRVVVYILAFAILIHASQEFSERPRKKYEFAQVEPEFFRMLDWVKKNTPADAILVGAYDPLYYLFTGRKAVRLSYPDPSAIYYSHGVDFRFKQAAKSLEWFKQIKACYVVQEPMISDARQIHYYFSLIQSLRAVRPDSVMPRYLGGGGWFMVYEISDCSGDLTTVPRAGDSG